MMRSVLVVGFGSIGKRHAENLHALGVSSVSICRRRLSADDAAYPYEFYDDLDEALAKKPDGVIVAGPTSLHLPVATSAVRAGCDLLIEKPVSHTSDGIAALSALAEQMQVRVQVAYCLRYHPVVLRLKQNLSRVGKILSVRAQVGQYLPDWRPGQDYRESYSRRSELGGGVLLDLSHEIDYLQWLFGVPSQVMCMASSECGLTVDTEECAALLWRSGGILVETHLDYWQRAATRTCEVIGSEGTLWADLITGEVCLCQTELKQDLSPPPVDRNRMYLDMLRSFCLIGKNRGHAAAELAVAASLTDGLHVVQLIEKAKASAGLLPE